MFLKREGNKKKYIDLIIPHFPPHKTYVEPFFGTGAIFWGKPLAKFNFLNDLDSFIFELWNFLKTPKNVDSLLKEIEDLLIYDRILLQENTLASKVLWQSTRFLGISDNIKTIPNNSKKILLEDIEDFKKNYWYKIKFAIITNEDVFKFLKSITYRPKENPKEFFVYLDPPYLNTATSLAHNKKWGYENLEELLDILFKKGFNFLISDYKNENILNFIKKHNLEYVEIRNSYSQVTKTEILYGNCLNLNLQNDLFY